MSSGPLDIFSTSTGSGPLTWESFWAPLALQSLLLWSVLKSPLLSPKTAEIPSGSKAQSMPWRADGREAILGQLVCLALTLLPALQSQGGLDLPPAFPGVLAALTTYWVWVSGPLPAGRAREQGIGGLGGLIFHYRFRHVMPAFLFSVVVLMHSGLGHPLWIPAAFSLLMHFWTVRQQGRLLAVAAVDLEQLIAKNRTLAAEVQIERTVRTLVQEAEIADDRSGRAG